jgi:uncharacterized OB-fold protein
VDEVAIAEGLFDWPSAEPHLNGSVCGACEAVTFPVQASCPRCGEDMSPRPLARTGTIWTWTSQEFPPVAPPYAGPTGRGAFQPYFVGYVELPGDLRVESLLVDMGDARPQIGQEVELRVVPLFIDEEGRQRMTFAFTPTGADRG